MRLQEKGRSETMNLNEIIRTRRNTKGFREDSIDQEKLLGWLETASYAPNHRRTEPWEVLFVGAETRAKLNHKMNFFHAPTVLAFLSAPGNTPLERDENMIAVSCFMQNFSLLAHNEGAGTRWASFGSSATAREILGVPEGYEVVSMLAVGYPEEAPETKPRTSITEKIKILA